MSRFKEIPFIITNVVLYIEQMTALVPSIDRAFKILECYKGHDHSEFGVSELSRRLELNKSSVHSILHTLSSNRILEKNPQTQKFKLGKGLREFAIIAQGKQDLLGIAKPHLIQLAENSKCTVFLGRFDGSRIKVLEKAEPGDGLNISVSVGQRIPFDAGCLGRVCLAWLEKKQLTKLLQSRSLSDYTPQSITDPGAFRKALSKTRKLGYALDSQEEYLKGVWACSVPVFDASGISAAMTLISFSGRIDQTVTERILEKALQKGNYLSGLLGAKADLED